ncbi:DUF4352 domain-containing protein [Aldersonia sp. NBC_00410]|uniref:DUF4352 domain-containing protein n=1 Tax=Aldersonia sp. NBC_00410 TaxID=2975954 RepID=UPI0022505819|nr:DUF4352 domain-containing protein [Aldersonia sp. NBC_00410]MCX5042061.1 DUF4352 domain-containing protein [Aldersonia sp. NBC_00410]
MSNNVPTEFAQQPGGQQSYAPQYPQQGAPQWGAPPQPPQKKKSRKLRWVLGAGVAIVAIIIVSNAGGGSDTDTAASEGAPVPAAAAEAGAPAPAAVEDSTPGIGAPVRDGKFEFVVTNVEQGLTTVGDNPYLESTAQGQYTVVHLTVRNTSDKPKDFLQMSQDLFDTQDRKFSNDTSAEIAIEAGSDINSTMLTGINPGNQIDTVVVFDLPAGAVADHIELHDSMFSNGVTVNLK